MSRETVLNNDRRLNSICLLSDFFHHFLEGILPGIHLDHSHSSNDLVHHLDSPISDTSCLESEDKENRSERDWF